MAVSNLTARVVFAVVAIPVVLAIIWAGGFVLASLLAVAGALATAEYYQVARAGSYEPMEVVGVPLAFVLPIGVFGYHVGRFTPPVLTLGAVITLAVFALAIFARGPGGRPIAAAAITMFGLVYGAGFLSFAYGLRYHNYAVGREAGAVLLVYPLVLTWLSDTAGFVVGRSIGRHKLMASVSPGKTVEGALGALVVCAVASWAYAKWALPNGALLAMRPSIAVLFGIVISVAVQLGDLAESLIKREAGMKDSSHLIPGHGGVLDRIDGLLFALPVAYLVFTFPHVLLPAIQ
ncbi:MAG TPA: phosphatidate cytidylyltransferase [Gemmatimonadaceae bacterium]|nr:phosphatidate cytidylyltransferase [Gemmatimonadaceae bacterium]